MGDVANDIDMEELGGCRRVAEYKGSGRERRLARTTAVTCAEMVACRVRSGLSAVADVVLTQRQVADEGLVCSLMRIRRFPGAVDILSE